MISSYEDEHLDHGERWGWPPTCCARRSAAPCRAGCATSSPLIQPDQDELRSAPTSTRRLCIQGAPGTGRRRWACTARRTCSIPIRSRCAAPACSRRAQPRIPATTSPRYCRRRRGRHPAVHRGRTRLRTGRSRATEDAALATSKAMRRLADVLRRAVFSHVARPVDDVGGARSERSATHPASTCAATGRCAASRGALVGGPRVVAHPAAEGRPTSARGRRRGTIRTRDARLARSATSANSRTACAR